TRISARRTPWRQCRTRRKRSARARHGRRMPRRFALALVVLLLLLLSALLLGRRMRGPSPAAAAVPTLRPTAVIPPTPIPARQVSLYFESPADDQLHPEARDVPAAVDDVAFLRSVAAAVMDGPRRQELVRPFPDGWSLRGAYLLRDGIAVIVAKNLPAVTRVVLLVAGEAVETLGGHADLLHPIAPDLRRAADEPALEAPATPTATPSPTFSPSPLVPSSAPSASVPPRRPAPAERT